MGIIMVKLKWDIDFGTRTILESQNHERFTCLFIILTPYLFASKSVTIYVSPLYIGVLKGIYMIKLDMNFLVQSDEIMLHYLQELFALFDTYAFGLSTLPPESIIKC